ncbi:MAG: hypothetical protein ACSLEN_07160 [Candidatus Malihini olakiniferum]
MLILMGVANSFRFSTMNILTLKDLSDNIASRGNSPCIAITMQLSMSLGVSLAGILLDIFAQQGTFNIASPETPEVFRYTLSQHGCHIGTAFPAVLARVIRPDQAERTTAKKMRV